MSQHARNAIHDSQQPSRDVEPQHKAWLVGHPASRLRLHDLYPLESDEDVAYGFFGPKLMDQDAGGLTLRVRQDRRKRPWIRTAEDYRDWVHFDGTDEEFLEQR